MKISSNTERTVQVQTTKPRLQNGSSCVGIPCLDGSGARSPQLRREDTSRPGRLECRLHDPAVQVQPRINHRATPFWNSRCSLLQTSPGILLLGAEDGSVSLVHGMSWCGTPASISRDHTLQLFLSCLVSVRCESVERNLEFPVNSHFVLCC
jgi:hypothetical protein